MAKSKCARGMTKSGRCKRKPGPKRGSKSRKMKRRSRKGCKYGKLKQPVKTKSGGKRRCKKKRSRKSKKGRRSKRKYKLSEECQKYMPDCYYEETGNPNPYTPTYKSAENYMNDNRIIN